MAQLSGEGAKLVTTRLLTEVFAGIEPGEPLVVVDLGPGCASTLNFLSQYRAKVFFADLPSCLPLRSSQENFAAYDTDYLVEFTKQHIGLAADTQIDICLFWDFLHYLELDRLPILAQALGDHMHRGTRAHGFGALHTDQPTDHCQYGIADLEHLQPLPMDSGSSDEASHRHHTHSQMQIAEHLTCLRIARGTLLREGRLEILFEAS